MPETPSIAAAVRARFAQALAGRAQARAGAARQAIDARLAALAPAAPATAAPTPTAATGPGAVGRGGALADLVAHAARQKTAPVLEPRVAPRGSGPDPAADPAEPAGRTLQFFKRTWSRLSADQRLAQSRATLPENAGPLNSHHLVHRSLTLMRDLSPEYLERFVAYVDALQWLEQSNEAAAQEAGAAARPAAGKRSLAARR